ncbi:MAG: UDP-N-acetylmuramate dehydrogenase [Anaerovoracaceae bacterium]|jgi:UDP-N-acetylmuramate dehydrogenase
MNNPFIFEEISSLINIGKVLKEVPMSSYTSFKAGGRASVFVEPGSLDELKDIIYYLNCSDTPYYILGNGTNTLVRDGGYKAVIIHIGEAFAAIKVEGERIFAGAGALLSSVALRALEYELSGMEFAGGIPGSVGGAAFMNAGAYDGEMKQVVEEVRILSGKGDGEYSLSGGEMEYGYRHSLLMERCDIVLQVRFKTWKGDGKTIQEKMKDFTIRRNEKQPLRYPSAGSFFKRPPGYFAGKLIEDAGLKGLSLGGARVSPLHAGFLINEKNATATEIIQLMEVVQQTVLNNSGILLEPEVRIIGEDGPGQL